MMVAERSGTIERNVKHSVLRWRRNVVSGGTTLIEDGRVRVPGECGSHRKHSVVECWSAGRRDDQSWRCGQQTGDDNVYRHVGCQLQGLSEIRRREAM